MLNFICENYITFFELTGILIMLGISVHISPRMKRLTRIMIVLLMIQTLTFGLEKLSQRSDTFNWYRPMLTATVYSLYSPIIIFATWMTSSKNLTKKSFLIFIPEAVCIPIFYTSQWTHAVCWFDEANSYHGGSLSLLPYLLAGFYGVVFLVNNIRYLSDVPVWSRVIMAYVTVGVFAGVVLYIAARYSDNYAGLFSASTVLYFLLIYIHIARVDSLTGLLNRQSYYREIDAGADKIKAIVSVDMNELKYINDNFGHESGDEALRTVADVLRCNCGDSGTVYRIGGDEFVVIYKNCGKDYIKWAVESMRCAMSTTKYSCAFGYALKENGVNIEATVHEADTLMYMDKTAMKEKMALKGKTLHNREE